MAGASAAAQSKIVAAPAAGKSHTTSPIVTGTSVVAVKYAGGVMVAADTLGSYGSLARFTDLKRIRAVGSDTLVAAGGEYSDFQQLMQYIEELQMQDHCDDDGNHITPPELLSYITRVMYNRRNKMNPLWNSVVVCGMDDGKAMLGTVDKIGTMYEGDFVATGFGNHLAIPILREHWRADLSEAEARGLIEQCLRVLYYRDCRTLNRFHLAKVTAEAGAMVSPAYSLGDMAWSYESFRKPKAGADTGGSW